MTTLTRLLAGLALGLAASAASALDIQPYSAQALAAAQKAGKPVALHFHADWCPTCRAQEKVFNRLKADTSLDLSLLV
ncbi:MAG TPA: thioredoxin family protein, partial [Zoogloea sp.]|nr:thioredoxin family protein [Zoogloea sp.]